MTSQEIWKDRIIQHLLDWVRIAEDAGQSPVPISFGSLVEDDITLRDALEMAGRNSRVRA